MAILLFLSAALVACAMAEGLRGGRPWIGELLVAVAVTQGFAAGILFRRFRPRREGTGGPAAEGEGEGAEPEADAGGGGAAGAGGEDAVDGAGPRGDADEGRRLLERATGPEGRYLVFLASVVFAAVEAHAVGAGMARGAPSAALALLVPPLAVGAAALRGAVRASGAPGVERGSS